jgi:hypothetical protein
VDIVHYDNLDADTLQNALTDEKYAVTKLQQKDPAISGSKNTNRDYLDIGGVFAILIGLYLILKQFDILPDRLAVIALHDKPMPVAEITFNDAEEHARSLADFNGKVLLLNVWAT